MQQNKINAILFDLGETLLMFGKIRTFNLFRHGARSSYNFLKSAGQPVGNFDLYFLRCLFSLRLNQMRSNITGNDFSALELFKTIFEKKDVNITEDQWRHLAWLWYEPLHKIATTEPDIIQTLTRLKEMGLKLGILSNTFVHRSSLEKHLQQIGILQFFTVRMYSYEFDFSKPDRRIFDIAAERIDEKFENIMFIGDRIDKDIDPALKLGMTPVMKTAYTNDGKPLPPNAHQIENISELPAIIEKLNTQPIKT